MECNYKKMPYMTASPHKKTTIHLFVRYGEISMVRDNSIRCPIVWGFGAKPKISYEHGCKISKWFVNFIFKSRYSKFYRDFTVGLNRLVNIPSARNTSNIIYSRFPLYFLSTPSSVNCLWLEILFSTQRELKIHPFEALDKVERNTPLR